MLAEGTEAPTFTLPGVVDGAIRQVDLSDYVGESIIVLAFYPADFNPAAKDDDCDLTELDLFTMQRDVDIFGIAPDSVYSHRAYAEQYSLSIPLLSDSHGEVIDDYDVRYETDDGLLARRAVYVIDQRGVVQYTWETDDLEAHPDVDAVREAVSAIGGDSTAVGRYRVGHAHYIEGRRAFTSAMNSYEDRDWLIAQGDFERAMEEFQEAADQFQSSVRFAESEPLAEGFERAQEKATSLWQAAEWLSDSASAYASGDGETAAEYREDAEAPLETARDIGEPPDPDDFDLDRITDAEAAAEATAEGDDGADLEAPTDPAEDEDDSSPGGGEREGSDDDIDAALRGVEVEEESDEVIESDEAAGTDGPPAGDSGESSDEDIDAVVEDVEIEDPNAEDEPRGDAQGSDEPAVDDGSVPETGHATEPTDTADGPGTEQSEGRPAVDESGADRPAGQESDGGPSTDGEGASDPPAGRSNEPTTSEGDTGRVDGPIVEPEEDAPGGDAGDDGPAGDDGDDDDDEEIELDLNDPTESG
ncbi:redoxin domain-containing protein [Halorientalis marina]|uniref:redoxin domain-containing protein n=1 Tax=Halorientalis marina TaxID=2931976 RepID=UPI001FF39448|nr:redoxin domain-containing protein [Halorientalis marina]